MLRARKQLGMNYKYLSLECIMPILLAVAYFLNQCKPKPIVYIQISYIGSISRPSRVHANMYMSRTLNVAGSSPVEFSLSWVSCICIVLHISPKL